MVKVDHFGSFASELPGRWREFVEANARTFDQTLYWFEAFERHLVPDAAKMLLIALSDSAGSPLALLPLKSDRIDLLRGIPSRAITALSNYYTALYDPVVKEGEVLQIAPALAVALADAVTSSPVVDLNPLAEDSPVLSAIISESNRRGRLVERYFRFGNWYLDVAGRSSKQYFESLPGQLRSTIVRKGKKLRALPSARIRIVCDPPEVPAAMDAYEAVYRSSWKTDEPHKAFIRAITAALAERGGLRLGLVEIQGRPVAAQLWFVHRRTASIFKLAYDEEYREHSAGSVLTSVLMERVIDSDKVEVVDYLCGDDAYKRDWMSARRERVGLRCVRRFSWQGALVAMAGISRGILGRTPGPP